MEEKKYMGMKKILIGLLILAAAGIYLLLHEETFGITITIAIFIVICLAYAGHTVVCVQEIEIDKEIKTREQLQQPPHWLKVLNQGTVYRLSALFKISDKQKDGGTAVETQEPHRAITFEADKTIKNKLEEGDEFVIFEIEKGVVIIKKLAPETETKQ